MAKNIVVCCDGTGNEISENISNVLKLYRCLRKSGKAANQVVFYDPGVGTLARPDPWRKVWQDAITLLGLATGYGLDDNILAAYEFIVTHYEKGDSVYLFGFSRGAYTVRVLAGLVHKIGLLSPEQINLGGSGLTAYKQFSLNGDVNDVGLSPRELLDAIATAETAKGKSDQAKQFARILSAESPTIRFVGVWDTVASVIVPRPDRFYLPSLQTLAFTRTNPSVQTFRQAISIDERRRMFRLNPWREPQDFMTNRYAATSTPQDILQVWFAGVHSDIGGGYPEKESGLSKYPLLWMIHEAVACGLAVNAATVNQLAWGVQRKGSPFSYVAPDYTAEPHDSLTAAWKILEYVPKSDRYKEWRSRPSVMGFYLPRAEPRPIPEGAHIHGSVIARMDALGSYRPINLPKEYAVVPMPTPPKIEVQQNEEV
jgi:uncharacterized protein (DUF2235 family)